MLGIRVHAGFWLVWLVLLGFCYFNSQDDPSSIFYNADTAYEPRYSLQRVAEVEDFLRDLPPKPAVPATPAQSDSESRDKFLCIGIPSVNRTTASFLSTTVATLTDKLTPDERASIHLVVLLADKSPENHYGYGQTWLENIADEVLVYGDHPSDNDVYRTVPFDVRTGHARGDGRVENMRLDHSVLVETCRDHGSAYFALVEDDIVASPIWLSSLRSGLAYIESQAEKTKKDWIYLRLFYSEVFMGWNNEEWPHYWRSIFLVYAVVVFGFVARMIFWRRFRLGPCAPSVPLANSTALFAAVVLCVWLPALIALYFLAGRVSVGRLNPFAWSWHGVREMPRYGCCAQGLVFAHRQLDGVMALFRNPPYAFAGDMILEDYARNHKLSKWALEPSVLQHIGSTASSAGEQRAEVWNFSFERQGTTKE